MLGKPEANWLERRDAIEVCLDPVALAKAALFDAHPTVRMAAVKRLADERVLADVAISDQEVWIQEAAVQRITSQELLAEVALQSKASVRARVAATHRIESQEVLAKIAQYSEIEAVRVAAILRMEDAEVLESLSRNSRSSWVRSVAANRLSALGVPAVTAPTGSEEDAGAQDDEDDALPAATSQQRTGWIDGVDDGSMDDDGESNAKPALSKEASRRGKGLGSLAALFAQTPVVQGPDWLQGDKFIGVGEALAAGQAQMAKKAEKAKASEQLSKSREQPREAEAAVSWRGRRGTLAQQLGIGAPVVGGAAPAATTKDVLKRLAEPKKGLAEIDESEEARKGWRKRIERAKIEVDQDVLAKMAQTDGHWMVRREAAKRLRDDRVLLEIACRDPKWEVRDAAIGRIADQRLIMVAAIKSECLDVRWRAIHRITDPVLLMEIAERISDERLIGAIRSRMSDADRKKAMEAWLTSSRIIQRRLRAVDALGGAHHLVRLAATMDPDVRVRMAAVERLDPTDKVLLEVLSRESDPQVVVAAIERADAAVFQTELELLVKERKHPSITAAATRALASIERHGPTM